MKIYLSTSILVIMRRLFWLCVDRVLLFHTLSFSLYLDQMRNVRARLTTTTAKLVAGVLVVRSILSPQSSRVFWIGGDFLSLREKIEYYLRSKQLYHFHISIKIQTFSEITFPNFLLQLYALSFNNRMKSNHYDCLCQSNQRMSNQDLSVIFPCAFKTNQPTKSNCIHVSSDPAHSSTTRTAMRWSLSPLGILTVPIVFIVTAV